jgi:hypothetical protein
MKVDIQGVEFELPPKGKVYNVITKKIEKRPIITSSSKKEDQVWIRTTLPEGYNYKRKEELVRQAEDKDYFDVELENFRSQEWDRRLNGVWFMNNGVATYLTGMHYLFLNWWKIDIGYPSFRKTDQDYFYFLQACVDNPNCLGMIELTKRRQGKTVRAGVFMYDLISRSKNKNGGIQSKTAMDAKNNVFQKNIVGPFKKLPDFFRPVYDQSKGVTPTSELRFYRTTKRGSKSLEDLGKPELESQIDWKSSDKYAYDGTKLHRYLGDEVGKTMEVDVWERHNVVRFCSELDGQYIGKLLYTTTVEEMESGGESFKRLWDASDQESKNIHGRTASGLYRFFTPSYKTLFFDKYGIADEDRAKQYYLDDRKSLAGDDRALSNIIRRNPFTIQEAFRIDGERSLFNSMKLNDRIDRLSWVDNAYTRGNFEWVGDRDTGYVDFKPMANGRFKVAYIFDNKDDANRVIKRSNNVYPTRKVEYVMGCDPYDHDSTVDQRRSDGAFYVYQKQNPIANFYDSSFIVQYIYRPSTARQFYEDVLKCCHYYSCQVLFEDNKIGIKNYFEDRGYASFLMYLPGSNKPGMSGSVKTHQQIAEVTEDYIETNIDKVYFKSLLKDWLEFDISKTTKFDAAMAAGYTLIADKNILYKNEMAKNKTIDAKSLFKKYRVR